MGIEDDLVGHQLATARGDIAEIANVAQRVGTGWAAIQSGRRTRMSTTFSRS